MIASGYIGTRFGTRVCIDQFNVKKRGTKLVLKCDCGRVSETYVSYANHGCIACVQVKHGYSPSGKRTPTYKTWRSMVERCGNPGHSGFDRYGGAGITICDKWKSFPGFLEDMGERPEGTSLDRINNDLGYSKENCRWASYKQQQRNKRTNVMVTINGETKCVGEWSELSGISFQALRYRIARGWSEDRLLSPVEFRNPRKEV